MRPAAARLRIPAEILPQTGAFLNWYFNTIQYAPGASTKLVNHSENGVYEYQWHPRHGERSRLRLAHLPSGTSASNEFDFTRLATEEVATAAPPSSLLLTTWFDLCLALEWLSDTAMATMAGPLGEITEADAFDFGEPLYR